MATKARKPRPPRVKQGHLPEMEPPSIKAIDQAAETYYDRMTERVELSRLEDEAKDQLIDVMKEHDLTRYEYDGKVVEITAKSNVRIKKKKEESGDAESNGEAE